MNPERELFARKLLPDLHKEKEVMRAVERKDATSADKTPNDPVEKADVYLERLSKVFLNPDERVRERNVALLKPRLHEEFVIAPEEVPESYFELQKRIARERGQAVEEIPEAERKQMIEVIVEDQTKSLDDWVEYLSSNDAVYPDWFKYFAFRNVVRLSQFDKERGEFKKRSKTTTAPYPEIYRDALAQVCDKYIALAHGDKSKFETDAEFIEFASKKFPTLYAQEIQKTLAASIEGREHVEGKWVTYAQGDMDGAEALYSSLQGKGTGWCTAGRSTAESQIARGDFHVYYTYKDTEEKSSGAPTQPRIAIRMDGSAIGEVRGVLTGQDVEPLLADVVEDRLQAFGSAADGYKKKNADMRRLTALEKAVKKQEELSVDDLRFLYEVDSEIEGFGYRYDPRIKEIQEKRDIRSDAETILKDLSEDDQIAAIAGKPGLFMPLLDQFEDIDQTKVADALLHTGKGNSIPRFMPYLPKIDQRACALKLIETGQGGTIPFYIENFSQIVDRSEIALKLAEAGHGSALAGNLANFGDVDRKAVALEIIDRGDVQDVIKNLEVFEEAFPLQEILDAIDKDMRERAILYNLDAILPHLSELEGINHGKLSYLLINHGYSPYLFSHFNKFQGLDKDDLVKWMVTRSDDSVRVIAERLESLAPLSNEIAEAILESPSGYAVLRNPEAFPGLDQNELIRTQLEKGKRSWVKDSGFNFRNITIDTVKLLLEYKMESEVVSRIRNFDSALEPEIIDALLSSKAGTHSLSLYVNRVRTLSPEQTLKLIRYSHAAAVEFANSKLFESTNLSSEIGEELIDAGREYSVVTNIKAFNLEDHDAIAQKLIARGKVGTFFYRLDDFHNLSPKTIRTLLRYNMNKEERQRLKAELREKDPSIVSKLLKRFRK